MKFRRQDASDHTEDEPRLELEPDFEPGTEDRPGRQPWSTAFLVVGSAIVGATALALWNRRTIANMRAQIDAQPEPRLRDSGVDDEFI